MDLREYLNQITTQKTEKGTLIIISGMSGAGKNVIANIFEEKHNCVFIDKYVTRPFRKDEIELLKQGKNIGIKSVYGKYNDGDKSVEEQKKSEAERKRAFIKLGLALSYINYENYYGLPMDKISNFLKNGRNVVTITNDPSTIKDLKNIYKGQCISLYVHRTIPKNKEIFMEIARQRGDTQESAEIRYIKALKDWDMYINNIEFYDCTILNTGNEIQKLSKMIEHFDIKKFISIQNEVKEKQGKPKIYVFSGSPGSGKDEALEIIKVQGILHSIILPKHATRHREKDDGEEMICLEDEGFNMESCDLQYNLFGTTYGLNTKELEKRLKDGISSSLVMSNKEGIEKLKKKFSESIVNIYIQGLSKEEYIIKQKEHLEEEYVKKHIEEYDQSDELYNEKWLDFNHVIIYNGDLPDLKRQIDAIQRYYEGERDLSGEKVTEYMRKAEKYIRKFTKDTDLSLG